MAYDWALIKREYVQGYSEKGKPKCPTLQELCDRHGCSLSTIMKRSSKENWIQERKLFGTKKEERIEEKKLSKMAEESANVDNKALNIANKGLNEVEKRLSDSKLSNHDILKLSTTATNFHKMGKLALGEPTEHIKEEGHQKHNVTFNKKLQDKILEDNGYDK